MRAVTGLKNFCGIAMERLFKYCIIVITTTILLCSLSACCKREHTTHQSKIGYSLHLEFDTELPTWQTIPLSGTRANLAESPDTYDVRYIIRAYQCDVHGKLTDHIADAEWGILRDDINSLDTSITIHLEQGMWRILVWADYVTHGSTTDLFYNTTDFEAIRLLGDHVGSNNFRDAFCGETTINVVLPTKNYIPHQDISIAMSRPLAKILFIATDFDDFTTRLAELKAEQAALSNEENSREYVSAEDIDKYRVVVRYVSNMPSEYDMLKMRPSDISVNVEFKSHIKPLSDTEAELAFDYVFVDEESAVNVIVEIIDEQDNVVARSSRIKVPYMQSQLTIVRGKFMTSLASGGVGIMPEFNGDWNYPVVY